MFSKNKMILLLSLLLISTIILAVFVYKNYYKAPATVVNTTTPAVKVSPNNNPNIENPGLSNDVNNPEAVNGSKAESQEQVETQKPEVKLSINEKKSADNTKDVAKLARKVYKANAMSFKKVCNDSAVKEKMNSINGQCFSGVDGYAIVFKISQGGYYCVDAYGFDGVVSGNQMPVSATDFSCSN